MKTRPSETTPLIRPLEDVTVLDLATALAGPFATLLLAGLGARVIKIENPANPGSCRELPMTPFRLSARLVSATAAPAS